MTPLYLAALGALGERETSLGALALIRPMIETLAHMLFIIGEDEMADAPCRAIRLEVGWARYNLGLAHASHDAEAIDAAQERLDEIDLIRTRRECRGGIRDYGDVDQTIRTIASTFDLQRLEESWRASSLMIHASGWDWTLAREHGRQVHVHPEPSTRAMLLEEIVALYQGIAQAFLVIIGVGLGSDLSKSINHAARLLRDDPLLERMVEGQFDQLQ